ncbi:alpha/beta fold hydrolase [Streptomyces sp. YIM 98790]|uniref:alpha/beta fold hydrolase n=1 Tax=Streptomyces sp. YIM 98790 TaxID=2689077 RepID=UPI00140C17A4|nr:alpha/beta fold hydrolase [Streptomyces sp. YIM 98790]
MTAPGSSTLAERPARQEAEPADVRVHAWRGYHCESRIVRAPEPRLAPVLLIGGALQRKEEWGRLERHLLAHADVISVDLPGWGAGDPLPEEHGSGFLADALAHMLAERGLDRVNVLGGSYGTAVAYRLAQSHPARVARMLLLSTMEVITGEARHAMRRILSLVDEDADRDTLAEACVSLLMGGGPDRPGAEAVQSGTAVRRMLLHRFRTATRHELRMHAANTRRLLHHRMIDPAPGRPGQPVLVAIGEHDTFTPPRLGRKLAATCPEGWFVEIARADHMVHLERTAEVVDLAARFFAGRPVTGLPYLRRAERIAP